MDMKSLADRLANRVKLAPRIQLPRALPTPLSSYTTLSSGTPTSLTSSSTLSPPADPQQVLKGNGVVQFIEDAVRDPTEHHHEFGNSSSSSSSSANESSSDDDDDSSSNAHEVHDDSPGNDSGENNAADDDDDYDDDSDISESDRRILERHRSWMLTQSQPVFSHSDASLLFHEDHNDDHAWNELQRSDSFSQKYGSGGGSSSQQHIDSPAGGGNGNASLTEFDSASQSQQDLSNLFSSFSRKVTGNFHEVTKQAVGTSTVESTVAHLKRMASVQSSQRVTFHTNTASQSQSQQQAAAGLQRVHSAGKQQLTSPLLSSEEGCTSSMFSAEGSQRSIMQAFTQHPKRLRE
eukprot:PhF_6_TR22347/c0_g1_i1/m.31643